MTCLSLTIVLRPSGCVSFQSSDFVGRQSICERPPALEALPHRRRSQQRQQMQMTPFYLSQHNNYLLRHLPLANACPPQTRPHTYTHTPTQSQTPNLNGKNIMRGWFFSNNCTDMLSFPENTTLIPNWRFGSKASELCGIETLTNQRINPQQITGLQSVKSQTYT